MNRWVTGGRVASGNSKRGFSSGGGASLPASSTISSGAATGTGAGAVSATGASSFKISPVGSSSVASSSGCGLGALTRIVDRPALCANGSVTAPRITPAASSAITATAAACGVGMYRSSSDVSSSALSFSLPALLAASGGEDGALSASRTFSQAVTTAALAASTLRRAWSAWSFNPRTPRLESHLRPATSCEDPGAPISWRALHNSTTSARGPRVTIAHRSPNLERGLGVDN